MRIECPNTLGFERQSYRSLHNTELHQIMEPWTGGAACDWLQVTWSVSRAGLALHLHVCRTDGKTMAITLPLVRLHIVPGRL